MTITRTEYHDLGGGAVNNVQSSVEPVIPVSPNLQGFISSRSEGSSNPDFKRIIARGDNATSNLSGTKRTVRIQRGKYLVSYQVDLNDPASKFWTGSEGLLTQSLGGEDPSAYSDSRASDMAMMRFIKKCIEAERYFQGGVFLGELRETLHMIRNPAKALRHGIDNFFGALKERRRRRYSAADRGRIAADTWLEYVFGWAPLINDLTSGAEALYRLSSQPLPFKMVRAFYIDDFGGSSTVDHYDQGDLHWDVTRKHTRRVIYNYYGCVGLSANGPQLSKALGVTLRDFVPTLWELIPYSFLVDYFTNVGDVLEAWSWNSSALLWSSASVVRESLSEARSQHEHTSVEGSPHLRWTSRRPCLTTSSWRVFNRGRIAPVYVPGFKLELPGFGTKWINLAALARSRERMRPY